MPGSAQPVAGPAAFLAEIRALSARLTALETWVRLQESSTWTEPTLLNSWANFGSGSSKAGYRIVGNTVRLRGTLAHSGASGSALFTLPAAMRPPEQFNAIGIASPGGTYEPCYIRVLHSGEVAIFYNGTPLFMAMDGVTFTID